MIETIKKKTKYMSTTFFFHCEYFVNRNLINKCQKKIKNVCDCLHD